MSMHASKQPDALLQGAVDEGYFKQQPWKGAGQARAEVNLHAMTAGVAMLSLYCWLVGLKQQVDQFGSTTLPTTLAIVTDKAWLSISYHLLSFWLVLYAGGPEQQVDQAAVWLPTHCSNDTGPLYLHRTVILSMSSCTPMQHVHNMCSCLLCVCWPPCSCLHNHCTNTKLGIWPRSVHHACPWLLIKGFVTDLGGCLVQGKGSREQGNLVVKEAVAAMMHKWHSAFRCGTSAHASCRDTNCPECDTCEHVTRAARLMHCCMAAMQSQVLARTGCLVSPCSLVI